MCGICGIIADDPAACVDPAVVNVMMDTLRHRGPDGSGKHLDGRVGLGHRRLAIIDLAQGEQPMYNEDRSVVVAFNGEVYNYVELRKDLQARGHCLATQSDTEVLVHLYEDFGDNFVTRLNGMFAFALWDAKKQRLLAARDRLGEKPFYYCQRNGRFLFASELKGLLAAPWVTPKVNLASLDHFLAYGYVPAPHTIFEDVYKLPAAHVLVWESGTVHTAPYWEAKLEPHRGLRDGEYVEELRRRLNESIRIRLRSDVPLGAFLSGGIDSSAVVALAAAQMNHPLETFCVGFNFDAFDESRYARLVADRFGTKHHEIVVRDLDVSVFPELVAHFDEPFADPSALPTYYVTREARRHVTVCLSGDGGDELFAGYDQYAGSRRRWVDFVPAGARRRVLQPVANAWPDCLQGKGYLRRISLSGAKRYQCEVGIFNPFERYDLLAPEVRPFVVSEPWLFEPNFAQNGRDAVAIRQQTDQRTYLPEDILVKVDRASMKNSLEVRVPFLDHTVVEWVNAMPTELKIRGRQRKRILKRMLAGDIPKEILERGKRGFGIPIRHWFRGNLDDFARDLLLSPQARSRQFFRPESVEQLLTGHRRGLRDLSRRLWAALWFEQWCRVFRV